MPWPGPKAEGHHTAESSALLAELERPPALDIWPCDPASQDHTWGGRLLCSHHSQSQEYSF